jgi:hypothetical protein
VNVAGDGPVVSMLVTAVVGVLMLEVSVIFVVLFLSSLLASALYLGRGIRHWRYRRARP